MLLGIQVFWDVMLRHWLLDLWRWRYYVHSKLREPLPQRHSVTSQKTRIWSLSCYDPSWLSFQLHAVPETCVELSSLLTAHDTVIQIQFKFQLPLRSETRILMQTHKQVESTEIKFSWRDITRSGWVRRRMKRTLQCTFFFFFAKLNSSSQKRPKYSPCLQPERN